MTPEYRACPTCGRLTRLPFRCRLCWHAMGYEGQRRFYMAQARYTQPGERR